MSNDTASPPQGYGHDAKGAAGGKNVPDGRVTVTHTEPIGTVGGKGGGPQMIKFELDGEQVEARVGETIWQGAKRQGREIPHLCYSPAPDYRPDGNCRACMVEIEGERVLAASCKRTPSVGMKVKTARPRMTRNRSSGTGPRKQASPKAAFPRPNAGKRTPAIRRCGSISMPAS